MLLVAPDPRHGISPARIGRVRALLDGLAAPGIAIALPGGPDGVLDALVLRPDGVLGLVPAAERVPVPTTAGVTGSTGGSQERAAAEIDRLLALADPRPRPRARWCPSSAARRAARPTTTPSAPTRTRASASPPPPGWC